MLKMAAANHREPAQLIQLLNKHNQTHLLKYKDQLKPEELEDLLDQINSIDFDHISQLYKQALGSSIMAKLMQQKFRMNGILGYII